jgi:rhodanese-related sulfurtransferase
MTPIAILPAAKLADINPHDNLVIDVRTAMEHGEKHLATPHVHVPLDSLDPTDVMRRHGFDKTSGVYIVCRSGKRAAQAADKFAAAGYTNVHVVEGGLIACEDCGHAVKGQVAAAAATGAKGPITLERQVRIVAGALAFAGAALALVVHPLFALLPLFIGGGLVFAGVTDRCGMALMLTKAPWNKPAGGGAACALKGVDSGQGCR